MRVEGVRRWGGWGGGGGGGGGVGGGLCEEKQRAQAFFLIRDVWA